MPTSLLDHRYGRNVSADRVASSLAELGDAVQWARDHRPTASTRLVGGPVGQRVRLSPGAIQLTYSAAPGWQLDRAELEAEALAEIEHVSRQLDRMAALFSELVLGVEAGTTSVFELEHGWCDERARFADRLEAARVRLGLIRGKGRGRVGEWSRKSRARMTRRFATLDHAPMLPTADRVSAMVTLTYPGDYLRYCPTGADSKRHLEAFRSWWERRMGPAPALWKLERQRRGAPHYHLLLMVPHAHDRALVELRQAARAAWVRIVTRGAAPVHGPFTDEHGDNQLAEDRRRMLRSWSVSIDLSEGARCSDPQRIAVYFSKHGAPNAESSKAYQNEAPDGWLDPEDGGGVGRWWGYWRLEPLEIDVELSADDADDMRRLLRGWVKAQGRTRQVVRRRIDRRTGVIRSRVQTERWDVRALSFTRPCGFVLANDAPALMRQIARALAPAADHPPGQPRRLP
jgi:hypothetical protein